ncbi:MAG: DUF4292 domain-containing protein [Cyclobacteriaceae bacterium]|jgi:hypothetical protein|nr:DUF4292 domain-containing protein [Cyclobacteriaceae bacterium]
MLASVCSRSVRWLLLAAVVGVFQSCSKKTVPVVAPPPHVDIQEIDFGYLQGKARLTFKDDKRERDVRANIRVRKDSVIWMTFSVAGIQGGKALLNKDSITVVSTVDKEYYVFSYAELSKRFNFTIDYATLEAALLGNRIVPKTEGEQLTVSETAAILDQQSGSVAIRNEINNLTKKIEKVQLRESTTSNELKIDYSNFQPVGNKLFPYNGTISVFYKTAAGIVNNTITLEYSKAEVGDKELKFPFNIPKRYERR